MELWNSLEYIFGQSNGAKLYHLQKEISKSVQENISVAGYFTTLKRLWDELDSLSTHLGCICDCVCDRKKKVTKFLEDQRVIQFLMGLNNVYGQARGNILMMNLLPNLDHSYLLLLQDESQREVYMSPQYPSDGASFMVGTQTKFQQRNNNHTQKPWTATQKFGNSSQKFKGKKSKYKPNVTCSHYIRIGHVRADCYKLIEFPKNFQLTKQPNNYQATVKENAVVTGQKEGVAAINNEGNMNNQP
ncbi:uncharacterized protein [Nicotiana tomentosiformis]|uniref:uncharacterized protein n=1 Tax=Nicotiana tomentosiformis TaxID=4098 RepID=UPI00388C7565